MKDKVYDYIITLLISIFTSFLGIYGDEIKALINNKFVIIINFLPVIFIVLLFVYYTHKKKKLEAQIVKQKEKNDFLKKSNKLLEGHIKRLESSIGQSLHLDQARRIIADYHKNKELIFYTVNLVELSVYIEGVKHSPIQNNIYDISYTWTIKGQAVKPIDDTILNDFVVSISSNDNIDKQIRNLEVYRRIDDIFMTLDSTQYSSEKRSETEYALHIPYGRCLEKGNTFLFKVHYVIENGFKTPSDKFEFTPSNCKYGKVNKFRFYIRSNLPLFHIATFKRENIEQNTDIENKPLTQQGEKLYELSYEIDCKEYESIIVETKPT